VRHCDCVAGQDIEPIDTAKRRAQCERIVEVKQYRIAPFLSKALEIFLLAHPDTDACIARVFVEIFQNVTTGLAGDAHKENEGTIVGFDDRSPVICRCEVE